LRERTGGAEDKILEGPEYFRCERFRCDMRKSICIERQDSMHQRQIGPGRLSEWPEFRQCQDCVQGKEIKKEFESENRGTGETEEIAMDQDIVTKVCRKCGVEKPLGEFPKNHTCKDGHQHTCKECRKKQAKERYLKNKPANKKKKHVPQIDITIKSNPYPAPVKRVSDWKEFAEYMAKEYLGATIEKYGANTKAPDLMAFTSVKICMWNILKYALRNWNGRGKPRDLEKIAHYAQVAHTLRQRGQHGDGDSDTE